MIPIAKRILIVEDDPSVLRATSFILEKEGITTIPEVLRNVYSSDY